MTEPSQPTDPGPGPGEPVTPRPADPADFEHLPTQPGSRQALREEDKMMLVLCYLGLLALIPYVRARDAEFVRFHARQGVALAIVGVIAWAVVHVPFVGFLGLMALAGAAALSLVGIVRALEGERWRMPIAAPVADRLGL